MAVESLIPEGKSLYDILNLDRETATVADVKSRYRKLALKYHPDKQPATATDEEKQQATQTFQQIGLAYSILSDPAKKSTYDRTGRISAEGGLEGDKDWTAYFKELWTGVVNEETIKAQTEKYQGSEEEAQDVLRYYEQCKGNMDHILNYVECCTAKDGERFAQIIQKAIDEKKVPKYKAFAKTTTLAAHRKRIQNEEKQQAEFDKRRADASTNKKDDSTEALQALIRARQQSRMEAVIDSIISKEKKASKRKQLAEEPEPTEEEFQRARERVLKKQKQKA